MERERMKPTDQFFIDSACCEGSDGTRVPVINPATEEAFADVCWGRPEDADLASESSESALYR